MPATAVKQWVWDPILDDDEDDEEELIMKEKQGDDLPCWKSLLW